MGKDTCMSCIHVTEIGRNEQFTGQGYVIMCDFLPFAISFAIARIILTIIKNQTTPKDIQCHRSVREACGYEMMGIWIEALGTGRGGVALGGLGEVPPVRRTYGSRDGER